MKFGLFGFKWIELHYKNYGEDGVPVNYHVLLKEQEKGVRLLHGCAVCIRLHQRPDANLAYS